MLRIAGFEGIDIFESDKYYKDIFTAVSEDIKDYRDEKYAFDQNASGTTVSLFDISDDDSYAFESLRSKKQGILKHAVKIIIEALMRRNKITQTPPLLYTAITGRNEPYFSIVYLNRCNKRTGVKLLWDIKQLNGTNSLINTIKEKNLMKEVDDIQIVILEKDNSNTNEEQNSNYYYEQNNRESALTRFNKTVHERGYDFISFITFDSFFKALFGTDEYILFQQAVDEFNSQKESMTGYKTLFMPNETEVERFKNKRLGDIKNFNYRFELQRATKELCEKRKITNRDYNYITNDPDNIIKTCLDRYINNLRFLIFIGDADFAESYISSEWYYFSSFETDILDKTAIAVGYLKSAEQLLYRIIRNHINDTNYKIQHIKKIDADTADELKDDAGKIPQHIPFDERYEEYFDTTFGSLITFIKTYKDTGLFENDISYQWKKYVIQYLYDYCKDYRNEHLHKDNIYSSDEISGIRKRTLLLYFILLGSFRLDDNNLLLLGGKAAFFKANLIEDLYLRFVEWMDSRIQKCSSNSSIIILQSCFDSDNESELLLFAEADRFDWDEYSNSSDYLNFDSVYLEYYLGLHTSINSRRKVLTEITHNYIKMKRAAGVTLSHKIILLLYGNGYIVFDNQDSQ